MKTKISRRKGRIDLVVDLGRKKNVKQDILAAMTLLEGTGCWQLDDVRLAQHAKVSPYFGQRADDYCASYKPKDADESAFVRSLLREYQEIEGNIVWCTFEGIVRGHPEVNGYKPVTWGNFDQAGYFSMAEGLDRLYEIKSFWDAFEGDPNAVKIENPHRQPTATAISMQIFVRKLELHSGVILDVNGDDADDERIHTPGL